MAFGILRPRFAEMHSDAPIDPRGVVGSEPLDIDGADASEATPIDQFTDKLAKERPEGWKRKVVSGDIKNFVTDHMRVSQSRVEFVQVAMLTFDSEGLITRLEEYWTSKGKYEKGRRDPNAAKTKKVLKRRTRHAETAKPQGLVEGVMYPCGALSGTAESKFGFGFGL